MWFRDTISSEHQFLNHVVILLEKHLLLSLTTLSNLRHLKIAARLCKVPYRCESSFGVHLVVAAAPCFLVTSAVTTRPWSRSPELLYIYDV